MGSRPEIKAKFRRAATQGHSLIDGLGIPLNQEFLMIPNKYKSRVTNHLSLSRTFLILALNGQGLGNYSVLGQLTILKAISGDWSLAPSASCTGACSCTSGKRRGQLEREVEPELSFQPKTFKGHLGKYFINDEMHLL